MGEPHWPVFPPHSKSGTLALGLAWELGGGGLFGVQEFCLVKNPVGPVSDMLFRGQIFDEVSISEKQSSGK